MAQIPKSSNFVEAWHNRWQVLVGGSHLSIGKIITELKKEEHETEGQVLRTIEGNVNRQSSAENRELNIQIMKKCAALDKISNRDFIEGMVLCLISKSRRV